jgi:hypothetical protein
MKPTGGWSNSWKSEIAGKRQRERIAQLGRGLSAGATKNEASVFVGAAPAAIRRRHRWLDPCTIARLSIARRQGVDPSA